MITPFSCRFDYHSQQPKVINAQFRYTRVGSSKQEQLIKTPRHGQKLEQKEAQRLTDVHCSGPHLLKCLMGPGEGFCGEDSKSAHRLPYEWLTVSEFKETRAAFLEVTGLGDREEVVGNRGDSTEVVIGASERLSVPAAVLACCVESVEYLHKVHACA